MLKLYDKVFVPVSVDERLPEKQYPNFVLYGSNGTKGILHVSSMGEWKTTHWLEEQHNVFVLTEEELKKFCTDFFYQWYNSKGTNTLDGFDDFLNSKLKP